MSDPWRVYCVCDHELLARGVLSQLPETVVTCVGVSRELPQALESIAAIHPDVVLLEERADHRERACIGTVLELAHAGRVVTIAPDRLTAIVYTREVLRATPGPELARALGVPTGDPPAC